MKDSELQEQFAGILEEHKKIVLKVCNLYCTQEEDRKDLFQDIVYQVWKAFPSFKGNAKVSTWLYRVALNTALNNKRKKDTPKRMKWRLFDPAAMYYPHQDRQDEQLELLEQSINKLNDLDKAITILYLDKNSYEDIAGIVGITKTNVATRISRIKDTLRKMMTEETKGGTHGNR